MSDTAPSTNKYNQALLLLHNHDCVKLGQIEEAAVLITQTLADVLENELTGIWLLNDKRTKLNSLYYYQRSTQKPVEGVSYDRKHYPTYFSFLESNMSQAFTQFDHFSGDNIQYSEFKEEIIEYNMTASLDSTIRVGGIAMGVLVSEQIKEPRTWTTDEVIFHGLVAALMSEVIQNNQYISLHEKFLEHSVRIRMQQKTLAEFMQNKSIIAGEIDHATHHIGHAIQKLYQANNVGIWLLNKKTNCFECHYFHSTNPEVTYHKKHIALNIPVDNDYIAHLAEKNVCYISHLKERVSLPTPVFSEDSITLLDASIRIADEMIGFMRIAYQKSNLLDKEEQQFLSEASEHIALTLINKERSDNEMRINMLSNAIECSASGILIANRNKKIDYVNPAFLKMTGYNKEQLVGKPLSAIKVGKNSRLTLPKLVADVDAGHEWRGEIEIITGNHSSLWLLASVSPIMDSQHENIAYHVAVCEDLTSLKERQKLIEKLAFYDPLTGLDNRRLFQERLIKAILYAQRSQTALALLYLDLDEFKPVNDNLGHDVGDELLKEVSQRLKACVRRSDYTARLGGDEFSILLLGINTHNDAAIVAKKLTKSLSAPFMIEGHSINITVSIGIAMSPHDSTDHQDLIKFADTAMYKAKVAGRNNYQFHKAP